jgi:uncharacterized protein (UPF0371 family)
MIKCSKCGLDFRNLEVLEDHCCDSNTNAKSQVIIKFDDEYGALRFAKYFEKTGERHYNEVCVRDYGLSVLFNISESPLYTQERNTFKTFVFMCNTKEEE